MDDNKTYEVCPFCGEEVELDNNLGVHQCPVCGHYIVSCSMCVAKDDKNRNYCINCCLEYLAKEMNENLVNERKDKIFDLIDHRHDMVIILEPFGYSYKYEALSFQFLDDCKRLQFNYLDTVEGEMKSEYYKFEDLPSKLYRKIIRSLERHKETYDRIKKRAIDHMLSSSSKPDFVFDDKEIPLYNQEYITEMYFLDKGDVEIHTKYYDHEDISQTYVTHPLNIPIETLEDIDKFTYTTQHRYDFKNVTVEYVSDIHGDGRNRSEARIEAEETLKAFNPNITKVVFTD